MKLQVKRAQLEISFFFAAGVTLLLILDESGTAAISLAACVLHECGHLLCLGAFGEVPQKVSLELFGMRIDRARGIHLSFSQEMAVALAGPACNLLLALVCLAVAAGGNTKMLTACAVNLGLAGFNLLPVEPLDGGQALYFALCRRYEEAQAKKLAGVVSVCLVVPLVVAGVALLVKSGYNFTLLVVSVYLFLLLLFKKEQP